MSGTPALQQHVVAGGQSGLVVLLDGWKRAAAIPGGRLRFVLCCPCSQMRRVLSLTGLDKLVPLYETEAEALAACG